MEAEKYFYDQIRMVGWKVPVTLAQSEETFSRPKRRGQDEKTEYTPCTGEQTEEISYPRMQQTSPDTKKFDLHVVHVGHVI